MCTWVLHTCHNLADLTLVLQQPRHTCATVIANNSKADCNKTSIVAAQCHQQHHCVINEQCTAWMRDM